MHTNKYISYQKTCIKQHEQTIYGMFVSNVMQQGDCNAPSTFQHAMISIFHEYIRIFLHMYLDNLFVCSNLV